MERNPPHLVLATGGTGGHFYPALAIAREFVRRGGRTTLLVAGRNAARQVVLAREHGVPTVEGRTVALPRSLPAALSFPGRLWDCCRHARKLLRELEPDVVLGMGGAASFPPCFVAARMNLPLILHEGNAVVGRANRVLARWARHMAISLPLAPGQNIRCPQTKTGLPLRDSVLQAAANASGKEDSLEAIGFSPSQPVLLVFGGSQGAQHLNATMVQAARLLGEEQPGFQLIHLTGRPDNDTIEEAYARAGIRARVRERDENIQNAYLAADLVLCRSGASTLHELALFGLPAVLVPHPTTADDHQTANARLFAEHDAARLLAQSDATPSAVAMLLEDWIRNPDAWKRRGRNAAAMAAPTAAQAIAEMLYAA